MKQKVTIFLIALFIILNINCNNEYKNKLTNEILMKKYFSQKDIKNLNKILLFFDEVVKHNCKDQNIINCYNTYFKGLKNNADSGVSVLKIDFDEQNKLLKSLDKTTFNKIWYYSYSIKAENTKITKAKIILLKPNSPYMNFLKEESKKKSYIKEYYDSVNEAGDITPGLINGIILYYNKYNLKDKKDRLILAIHYLTINSRN